MSLINDLLRDLEAKRPDDLARQNLQREIRALPRQISPWRSLRRAVFLVGLPVIGISVALLHANGYLVPLFISGNPAAESSLVLTANPVVPPADSPSGPAQAVEMTAAVDSTTEPNTDNLRLARALAMAPMVAEPLDKVPDPVAATATRQGLAPPVSSAGEHEASPSVPVRIEKSPVVSTVRDRAESEFRKAETASAGGRVSDALEAWRAALRLDPAYVPARQALLRQALDNGRIEEAMTLLQDGLDLQPSQIAWAMSLARLHLERNDLNAADRVLVRYQGAGEASADYAGFQGYVKTRLATPKNAVAYYQRAARLAPGEGRWWLGLGLALEADGKTQEAREAFRRSLQSATLSADLIGVAEQHLRP